ncbi:FadR/GntR family transcriptional regulator [Agromyces mediolanus]|uniref:GntR family transcriptional regulator n=1 Tax=Agromyces mediolanus TaxID=41986 RepID=A0A918F889_AGRME|nr:FCD domain-containing protein [Agromyces mediolanus]GGR14824.1 GntR family transcriptional regulator [Agromyces mediolanus]GLJ73135.1 GntR family transcriptional regulator [Agromyces mediolanus]
MDQEGLQPQLRRSSQLADLIVQRILDQGLAVGTRLGTKQSLAEEYGVAVATLTEAIRALEELGRVETRTGRYGGVFVREPSEVFRLARGSSFVIHGDASSFSEMLQVVDALEPEIAQEAALHCSPADARLLRERLARLEQAWTGAAAVEQQRRNWELHLAIGAITPNRTLSTLYTGMLQHVANRLEDRELGEGPNTVGLEIHQQLVEAIIAGDVAGAREQARRHRLLATGEELEDGAG